MDDYETRADRRAGFIPLPEAPVLDGYADAIEYRPQVPDRVRDGVYWLTLGTAAASALASGIAGIWFPDISPQVLATGGVATTVMGIIGGGVGVIYRPGAQ